MVLTGLDLVSSAYLFGLTFDCHLGCDLEFFLKTPICLSFLLFSRRSFWSFYQVQDPSSVCIPISKKAHISDAMRECYVMYDLAWMKCLCIRFTFMVFSLLILPLSRLWTFCGPVGAVSFSSTFEDTSVSMLTHRIVSHFLFFGTQNHSCLNPLYIRHGIFRFHALDFTTLALSINSTWIMENH